MLSFSDGERGKRHSPWPSASETVAHWRKNGARSFLPNGKPIEFREINKTLAKALTDGTDLIDFVKAKIEEASSKPGGLL